MTLKTNPEVDPVYLLTKLVELETKMQPLAQAIIDLRETNEGTLRTRGIKEKLVQAEIDIKANKEAWEKVDNHISELEMRIMERISAITRESEAQKTLLDKVRPWIGGLSWLVTGAGAILLSQFLSGKWIFHP